MATALLDQRRPYGGEYPMDEVEPDPWKHVRRLQSYRNGEQILADTPGHITHEMDALAGHRPLLYVDCLVSSFAHVVRATYLVQELRTMYPEAEVIFPLPSNSTEAVKLYLHNTAQLANNCTIIDLDVEQLNLNAVDHLIPAVQSGGNAEWIRANREVVQELKPNTVVMSSGLFGPYYAGLVDAESIIAILDTIYSPRAIDVFGIDPKLTRSEQFGAVLRPIWDFIVKHKLTKPFFKGFLINWQKAGVPEEFWPHNLDEMFNSFGQVLIPNIEVWDPGKARPHLPDNYKFVGPMEVPLIREGLLEAGDKVKIEVFRQAHPNNVTLVFIGGSVFDNESDVYSNFIKKLTAEVEKGNPEAAFIIACGQNVDLGALVQADNVLFFDHFVPVEVLMSHSDLVVATPGQGTAMKAVELGKYIIGIPVNVDQLTHALRCQYFGVGEPAFVISSLKSSQRVEYTRAVAQPQFPAHLAHLILKAQQHNPRPNHQLQTLIKEAKTRQAAMWHEIFPQLLQREKMIQ